MEAVENIIETSAARRGKLLKILGIGFGIAVGVGTMVGVGILRSPGPVAGLLGSPWLITYPSLYSLGVLMASYPIFRLINR